MMINNKLYSNSNKCMHIFHFKMNKITKIKVFVIILDSIKDY